MEKRQDEIEIDLLKLVQMLWNRVWVIVIATVLSGVIALSYTCLMITPMYQAKAMMYVNNSSISVGSTSVSLADLSAAQNLVNTYVVILKTRTTLNDVIAKANLDYSYEELYNMIQATAVNSTEIFQIVVTSPSPQEAEKIANTIVRILPDKISSIVEGSSACVVDYAVVPTKKTSPSISRNTAMGMLLGFVASCMVLVVMELLDEQIKDEDYLMQTYDLPILAVIPDLVNSQSSGNDYNNYKSAFSRKETKS